MFSYLIIYKRESKPLGIVAVVHGKRDVEAVLASAFSLQVPGRGFRWSRSEGDRRMKSRLATHSSRAPLLGHDYSPTAPLVMAEL